MVATSSSSSSSTPTPSNNSTAGAFTTLTQRVTFEKEIKKSKFIAIAGPFLMNAPLCPSSLRFVIPVQLIIVGHTRLGINFGNDDGEPSGTAGKPIQSAIDSSGIDRVMVVVIRYFGGIKLGTGGLVRAYGGVAAECLRNAPTCVVKSKVPMGLEVPYDLLGVLYHQLQSFQVEDIRQDMILGKIMLQWSPLKLTSTEPKFEGGGERKGKDGIVVGIEGKVGSGVADNGGGTTFGMAGMVDGNGGSVGFGRDGLVGSGGSVAVGKFGMAGSGGNVGLGSGGIVGKAGCAG
ncbi:IMPACT family member in pol 5'region [Sesamum angolense]|uniref:IMPACT family member in pol 5'region n=1 Tax=Sesamum angolense TaxID=2727404 RepID=A0AAE2C7C9_9LAMI|nr:IMPACT family member in pol 5'region [Sesamum angolense]